MLDSTEPSLTPGIKGLKSGYSLHKPFPSRTQALNNKKNFKNLSQIFWKKFKKKIQFKLHCAHSLKFRHHYLNLQC